MPQATYGRLDEVLRSLGFSARTNERATPKARVYQHDQSGALIVLPVLPEGEVVLPHHLITVQATLDDSGLATPAEFADRLQQASQPSPRPA
jgi:hypothetical protein